MWSTAGLLISLLETGKNVVLWEGGVQKAKTVAAFLAPVDAFFFFVPNLSFGGPWQMSKARAGIPG